MAAVRAHSLANCHGNRPYQCPTSVHWPLRHRTGAHVPSAVPGSRLVVATSEHWWEDEQEFDAITEVLLPKQVYITTPPAAAAAAAQLKQIPFAAAFAAPSVLAAAEEVWGQVGRAGPPLFLKLRTRSALEQQQQQQQQASSSTPSEALWEELCSQSWRTELDYGLGGSSGAPDVEPILLLCDSAAAQDALIAGIPAAGDDQQQQQQAATAGVVEGVAVVLLQGWNQGEVQQQRLDSWKQLQPVCYAVCS